MITESNGSSSMGSVCGGCLALQDAGVPVKSSIAGIAMGMVLDTKEFGGDGTPLILSDITGGEDVSGDMDFTVLESLCKGDLRPIAFVIPLDWLSWLKLQEMMLA